MIGIVGMVLGMLLLYAAGRHQKLLPAGPLPRLAVPAGVLLLAGGCALVATAMAVSAAIFVLVVVAMAVGSLVPLLAAWLRARKAER